MFLQSDVGTWFITPDRKIFPSFDKTLRLSMRAEIELLFEIILQEDRSIVDLVNADYIFINERLVRQVDHRHQ